MKKLKIGKYEGTPYWDKDSRGGLFLYRRENKNYFYISKIFKAKDRGQKKGQPRLERRDMFPYENKSGTIINSVNLPVKFIPPLIELLQEFYAEEMGIPQVRGKDKDLTKDIMDIGLK